MQRIEMPLLRKRCLNAVVAFILILVIIEAVVAIPKLKEHGYSFIFWNKWPVKAWFIQLLAGIFLAAVSYQQSRTFLEFDISHLWIHGPFGSWRGPWSRVQAVSYFRNRLTIQIGERIWQVSVGEDAVPAIERLKRHLPPGVWKDTEPPS